MALSFLYQLVRRVLELVRSHRMDSVAKGAEILVLRQQLAVLRRHVGRLRSTWTDRALIALLSSLALVRGGAPSWSRHTRSSTGTAASSGEGGLTRTNAWVGHRYRPRVSSYLPLGEEEPEMGVPTDRGRAEEARGRGLEDKRRHSARRAWPSPSCPAGGTELVVDGSRRFAKGRNQSPMSVEDVEAIVTTSRNGVDGDAMQAASIFRGTASNISVPISICSSLVRWMASSRACRATRSCSSSQASARCA